MYNYMYTYVIWDNPQVKTVGNLLLHFPSTKARDATSLGGILHGLDGLNDLKAFPDLGPPGDARGVRQADLTHLEEVVEVFALESDGELRAVMDG